MSYAVKIHMRFSLGIHFRKLGKPKKVKTLKDETIYFLFQISNVVFGGGLFGSHGAHVHVLYDNGKSPVGITVNWGINSASIGFDPIETKGRNNGRKTLKL